MTIYDFQIDVDGLRPALLGMTRAEIDAVLGDHPRADGASLKGEEAFRYHSDHVRVVMRQDRAVEIALVPPVQVTFRGRSLFGEGEVWRELVELDGDAQEVLGFIVLLNLGLTLTGLHDGDRAQFAVTAFETGRWDALSDQNAFASPVSCRSGNPHTQPLRAVRRPRVARKPTGGCWGREADRRESPNSGPCRLPSRRYHAAWAGTRSG